MALPSTSNISHHLTDRALNPLFSSSSQQPSPTAQSQSSALSSLTTTAISAFDSASRLGLGLPLRIMVEGSSSGSVVLHSFINPQSSRTRHAGRGEDRRGIVEQVREQMRPLSGTTDGGSVRGAFGGENDNHQEIVVNGIQDELEEEGEEGGDASAVQLPPLLIGTVIAARPEDAGEARRAAGRLERLGREFQREWVHGQQVERREVEGEVEDG